MNEGVSVRTCNAKDIETLVALGIKTFRDAFDDFNTTANMMKYINKTFTFKALAEDMKRPGTIYFLAVDDRKPAGYAKISAAPLPDGVDDASALQIERLYAQRQYLGKRVGYMLMKTCVDFAQKKGARTLWLGVWENNSRAIAFYEKNGFRKFGQQSFMLGDDTQTDWLMKKELTHA
jgi:ribosomal protein S18 acetylase RimI-like enzyme